MTKLQVVNIAASSRSPERDKLAAAIEARDRAADRLARINDAANGTFVWTAMEEVEAKQKALASVRQRAPRVLVAQLIGDMGATSESVDRAQWELEEAEGKLKLAQSARAALEDQQRETERELERGQFAVKAAISRVVTAEGGADSVLTQFDAARREVARLYEILSLLSAQNCVPPYWESLRPTPLTLADSEWREVFGALEVNADVPLPE